MNTDSEKQTLENLLGEVRQKIFLRTTLAAALQLALIVLPVAAIAVAIDQRWGAGGGSGWIFFGAFVLIIGGAAARAASRLTRDVDAALEVDHNADLKDRISSAHEFLNGNKLDAAQATQVEDAISHARRVNASSIVEFTMPRQAHLIPVFLIVLGLSFLVPPVIQPQKAEAKITPVKQLQLAELENLKMELVKEDEEELKDTIEKIQELERKFEEGELNERDVMLELGRLNEDLQKMADEMGVEKLESEIKQMIPHLAGGNATKNVASALKEEKLDEAAKELEKLGEKVEAEKLDPDTKKQMAMNFGLLAAKLGSKNANSFSGDFKLAEQSLKKSDSKSFCKACKNIGDKLKMVKKVKKMCKACKKIGMCKACIGQCESKEGGYKLGPKMFAKKKGGLKAGTAESGDPFGARDRLENSYKKMMQVSGMAGEGPVESEVEITDGQLTDSQLKVKKLHADFSAVAEEAIEDESIPLSHRYHVKRYFQSIKPQE